MEYITSHKLVQNFSVFKQSSTEETHLHRWVIPTNKSWGKKLSLG